MSARATLVSMTMVIALGCGRDHRAPIARGAGGSLASPLVSRWAEAFPGPGRVDYQPTGSEGALTLVELGTVDFGVRDTPLTDAERARAGASLVELPLAHGAVAVAANLPGVSDLKLDRELLAGLFLGEIPRWSDPRIARTNPGKVLPDVPVLVVHRADGSGTMRKFSEYVAAASPRFREIAGAGDAPNLGTGVRARGTGGVAMSLKSTLGAVGVLELGLARSSGLSVASLEGAGGAYVAPSPEGNGYPLVSTIYAISNVGSGPRATLVASPFSWALGAGQSAATFGPGPHDPAFGPLTPSERDAARKALEAWSGARS